MTSKATASACPLENSRPTIPAMALGCIVRNARTIRLGSRLCAEKTARRLMDLRYVLMQQRLQAFRQALKCFLLIESWQQSASDSRTLQLNSSRLSRRDSPKNLGRRQAR